MRSGLPYSRLITFDSGPPVGGIAWTLLDGDGNTVTSGTLSVSSGDVSATLIVGGTHNTVSGSALVAYRDLSWSYSLAGGAVIAGTDRYRLSAFLPFGVSERGVRAKLGVEEHELPDETIDLARAYSDFRATVGADTLSAANEELHMTITDAIEADAALSVLPSLMVRLAAKEDSGTNSYTRLKVDWDELRAWLAELVGLGIEAVAPEVAANLVSAGSIFLLSEHGDPVTGQ